METNAVVVVDHVVAAFGTLDEFPTWVQRLPAVMPMRGWRRQAGSSTGS
jgi:hypothetical protein